LMSEALGKCDLWTRARNREGYGEVWHDGRLYRAHRLAWELSNGPIPEGLLVLHKCDTPACVNVEHLFIGTHTDNMADRKRKGRQARGEQHGSRTHPESVRRGERHWTKSKSEKIAAQEKNDMEEKARRAGRPARDWVNVMVRLHPEQGVKLRQLAERLDIPQSTLLRRAADKFLTESGL
jgi:hypothetical protein